MHLCCARKSKNPQIGFKKVEYKTETHTTRDDIGKFSCVCFCFIKHLFLKTSGASVAGIRNWQRTDMERRQTVQYRMHFAGVYLSNFTSSFLQSFVLPVG